MKINIKYTNLDSTPAMTEYVDLKIGSLDKFIGSLHGGENLEAFVEVSRTSKHHQKGDVFRAECNLELPGKLLRAEYEDWDARRAVDEVQKIMELGIKKYKEVVRAQDSHGAKDARELRGK